MCACGPICHENYTPYPTIYNMVVAEEQASGTQWGGLPLAEHTGCSVTVFHVALLSLKLGSLAAFSPTS